MHNSRSPCKNTNMNNPDSVPLPEVSNPIANHHLCPPMKSNLPRTQDNAFKIAAVNTFKDVKETMNEFLMKTVKTQTVE